MLAVIRFLDFQTCFWMVFFGLLHFEVVTDHVFLTAVERLGFQFFSSNRDCEFRKSQSQSPHGLFVSLNSISKPQQGLGEVPELRLMQGCLKPYICGWNFIFNMGDIEIHKLFGLYYDKIKKGKNGSERYEFQLSEFEVIFF